MASTYNLDDLPVLTDVVDDDDLPTLTEQITSAPQSIVSGIIMPQGLSSEQQQTLLAQLEERAEVLLNENLRLQLADIQQTVFKQTINQIKAELPQMVRKAMYSNS